MKDRVESRERVRDIHAGSTTWWWWWLIIKYKTLFQRNLNNLCTMPLNLNLQIWKSVSIKLIIFPEILRYKWITGITAISEYLVLINKKKITCHLIDFVFPAYIRLKIKENEKIDKYFYLVKEQKKKKKNVRVTVILTVVGAFGTVPKTREIRYQRKNRVTQVLVKDHQLMLMWKIYKEYNNMRCIR